MKIILATVFLIILHSCFSQAFEIGLGQQPQLSLDTSGIIRLIYGQGNKIYYSVYNDNGDSFSIPTVVAEVNEMHLGMTRGPKLASSIDYSVVTAIDKKGNIHSFQLEHKINKWRKIKNVNDAEHSAPEGMMSVTADELNNFYAVWLDLRDDKNNKIAFSTLTKNGSWSKNRIVYKSPDKTVCECCKPTVAVQGKTIALMFRNWIDGSRDLYLLTSSDGGVNFGAPAKLGTGTWKLKGCPMDGGEVLIDKHNAIHTVWQREGTVYYDQPGKSEIRIADGRSCNLFGSNAPFITWQEGGQIYGRPLIGNKISIGEGSAANIVQLKDKILLVAWENNGKIFYRKL